MKRLLLLFLCALAPAANAVQIGDCLFHDTNEGQYAAVPTNWRAALFSHNCARLTVSPRATPGLRPLRWDATIATFAQNYANTCNYNHNPAAPYGENLYAGAQSSGFPTGVEAAAIANWAGEHTNYNYATNTCPTGVCGHYTQMVWRNSTAIGCGLRQCTTNSPFPPPFTNWTIVVCNYNPEGNISGQRPY